MRNCSWEESQATLGIKSSNALTSGENHLPAQAVWVEVVQIKSHFTQLIEIVDSVGRMKRKNSEKLSMKRSTRLTMDCRGKPAYWRPSSISSRLSTRYFASFAILFSDPLQADLPSRIPGQLEPPNHRTWPASSCWHQASPILPTRSSSTSAIEFRTEPLAVSWPINDSNHLLVWIILRWELTLFTFSKSNVIPVGRRSWKYWVIGLPISMLGCLLSLLADQDSIRLFPAATISISLFRIIPEVRDGCRSEMGRGKKLCKDRWCKVSERIAWLGYNIVLPNGNRSKSISVVTGFRFNCEGWAWMWCCFAIYEFRVFFGFFLFFVGGECKQQITLKESQINFRVFG